VFKHVSILYMWSVEIFVLTPADGLGCVRFIIPCIVLVHMYGDND
jgi:hypothetical protein